MGKLKWFAPHVADGLPHELYRTLPGYWKPRLLSLIKIPEPICNDYAKNHQQFQFIPGC
jgi:hypothetical protein